jgi:glyoxylase I family protein
VAIEVCGVRGLIQVFDMPTSLRFYRDVLGFKVVQTSDPGKGDLVDWCWLKLHDAELMLNTAYEGSARPPQPDPQRTAAHEDTCFYFGCPDVDGAYGHLREQGADVHEPTIAPYGMKQLYVLDPDGYMLCFQWNVARSKVG